MRKKFGIFLMTIGILLFALYFAARLIPNYYSENDISKDISSTEMEQNNKKEFKNDIVRLRHSIAKLLGHETYAY